MPVLGTPADLRTAADIIANSRELERLVAIINETNGDPFTTGKSRTVAERDLLPPVLTEIENLLKQRKAIPADAVLWGNKAPSLKALTDLLNGARDTAGSGLTAVTERILQKTYPAVAPGEKSVNLRTLLLTKFGRYELMPDSLVLPLEATQRFYQGRIFKEPDALVLDGTFKRAGRSGDWDTIGKPLSRIMVLTSKQYGELLDEDDAAAKPEARQAELAGEVETLRNKMGQLLQFIPIKVGDRNLDPADTLAQKDAIVSLLKNLSSESVLGAMKRAEARLKKKKGASEAPRTMQPDEAPEPADDFMKMQQLFTEELFTELKSDDGKSFMDIVTAITGGRVTKFYVAGAWRDGDLARDLEAADLEYDVGPKRLAVDGFVNTIPGIVRENLSDLCTECTPEELGAVRLAGLAVHELAIGLRMERQKVDNVRAEDTANLVGEEYPDAFRKLFAYKLMRPPRPSLVIPDRLTDDNGEYTETEEAHRARVAQAIEDQGQAYERMLADFRQQQRATVFDHLRKLVRVMDEPAKNLGGIFVGTLNTNRILPRPPKGKTLRDLIKAKIDEIRVRAPDAEAETPVERPSYQVFDFDAKPGKWMQPPTETIEQIESLENKIESVMIRMQEFQRKAFEIQSRIASGIDLALAGKAFEVLDSEFATYIRSDINDIYGSGGNPLKGTDSTLQHFRNAKLGSLVNRATRHLLDQFDLMASGRDEIQDRIDKTRDMLSQGLLRERRAALQRVLIDSGADKPKHVLEEIQDIDSRMQAHRRADRLSKEAAKIFENLRRLKVEHALLLRTQTEGREVSSDEILAIKTQVDRAENVLQEKRDAAIRARKEAVKPVSARTAPERTRSMAPTSETPATSDQLARALERSRLQGDLNRLQLSAAELAGRIVQNPDDESLRTALDNLIGQMEDVEQKIDAVLTTPADQI